MKIENVTSQRIKSLPIFYVDGNEFSIGVYKKANKNDESIGVLITYDPATKKEIYQTFYTKNNLLDEITKILAEDKTAKLDTNANIWSLESPRTRIETSVMVSQISFAKSENVVLVGQNSIPYSLERVYNCKW